MKTLLYALLFGGVSIAEDDVPPHARVSIQYIELPHPALVGWLGEGETGAAIHTKAMALAESGEAKILETCMVVCRGGNKATVESVLMEMYPRGVEADDFRFTARASNPPYMDQIKRSFPVFETQNAGITFDAELTIDADRPVVDLRVSPEFAQRLKLETWLEHKDQWGDASLRMPIYEKWATNSSLTLQSGKSELVSVITPEAQPPAPAVSRRVLLFVRADVIVTPLKP